ncbi:MAG: IS66 family insertion sequence element accessory protein TnpA [Bosea sp. (in: a-proteobacteria)]
MTDEPLKWARRHEAFWREHHEAWKRSALNQREYCASQGIPLKAFGNWRAIFKAEPKPPTRKILYRRGGLSHTLNHSLSHPVSHPPGHGAYPSLERSIVPPPRDGHRRRFTEADKHRILEEAQQSSSSLAQIARNYGIARRVLCRWKQDLAETSPVAFVTVQVTDLPLPSTTAGAQEQAQ